MRNEISRLANEPGFLVQLHVKLLRCSEAVADDAGLSITTNWERLRHEMHVQSVEFAQALVAHASDTNSSFREALALVRNKLAPNEPILPLSVERVRERVALPPLRVPRTPLQERPYEAVRVLCLTPEDVRTDDMKTQWKEIERKFLDRRRVLFVFRASLWSVRLFVLRRHVWARDDARCGCGPTSARTGAKHSGQHHTIRHENGVVVAERHRLFLSRQGVVCGRVTLVHRERSR